MNANQQTAHPLPVIINRRAGSVQTEGQRETVENAFREADLKAEIQFVEPEDLDRTLDQVLDRRPPRLVLGGGDGTLNSGIQRLVGGETALGILPVGTMNHYAKNLGLPVDVAAAAKILARDRQQALDLGSINGRYFLNNALLGIYPHAVARREAHRQRLGMRKFPAMGYAFLGALWKLRTLTLSLETETDRREVRTPFVMVSNNRYVGGVLSGLERDDLQGGQLGIYYTPSPGRGDLFRLGLKILTGRLEQGPGLETMEGARVRILNSHHHYRVAIDGEVLKMRLPLELKIHPGVLRVIVAEAEA